MKATRRQFLQHSSYTAGVVSALSMLPRPLTAMFGGSTPEPIPPIQDDRIKALVQRGLDAARAAKAEYADIRLTHTRERGYGSVIPCPMYEREYLHVGVRALVNGYWGFASSPIWNPEELARLGQEAVRQAKANTFGKPREILFAAAAAVQDGHWETPVEIDPFAFHPDEIGDYLLATAQHLKVMITQLEGRRADPDRCGGSAGYSVTQQSKAFGSTDNTYLTQRIFRSAGSAGGKGITYEGGVGFEQTGAGWELFRNSPIVELVRENMLSNQELARLPWKPLDVGRYATVLDAKSVANLLSVTIGSATQLDRALGYESNAKGSSYLVDPEEMLGTFMVGGSMLTVTANRTERGGIATTRWDDEGAEPVDFTLINRGALADFQTSREGAGWLKARYDQLQRPFQSNGCMYSEIGTDAPSIHTPNLVMQPSAESVSHADLEAGMEKGMSLVALRPSMDFQLINGYSPKVECFEIAKGKRVARIRGAGILFRTPELWKSVVAIGGATSQKRFGLTGSKGEPSVQGYHSVTAVPVALKELTFIDSERR